MNIGQTLDYWIDSKPVHSVARVLFGENSLKKTSLSILYRLKLALSNMYTPAVTMEEDEITKVYRGLEGKTLHLPDLRPVYAGWAEGRNRHYERLLPVINEYIDKYIDDAKFAKKLKAVDLAAFTAVIYPDAEWDRLVTMGILCFFLFAFDDMIDKEIDPNVSDLASDIHSANQFRDETALYIKKQLESPAKPRRRSSLVPQTAEELPSHKLLPSFRPIAQACAAAAPSQINRPLLAQDLEDFFLSNGPEQKFRLAGTFPTIDEYWAFRHGTGAVFIFADLAQYMADTHLTAELAWCDEVNVMRFEMSLQPILCNDLFSLKKEMREGTASNLVPITLHEKGGSLAAAVGQVVDQMYASAERFEAAAAALRAKSLRYDEKTQEELGRFVATFESFQTGCFRFYMESRRFGIMEFRREDGSFEIPL
ncbi:terpenoid synthase [Apiospora marii]|uniref:Terpenoid synthase n=1 Tax=Apiospora marii TaxID=335849 RepID=A0ABR1S0W5_9PEZI